MNDRMHGSVISNFLFLFMSQYGSMAVNISFSLILTRLLVPTDFGQVAVLMFYFTFANIITEWGWEHAFLVHKELPLEVASSTHLFIRTVGGLFPLIGCSFYFLMHTATSPIIIELALMLALAHLIEKVGFVYRTALERVYNLRSIAMYEFTASIMGYVIAFAAAYAGWGVLSLGIQRLVEKGLIFIGYWRNSSWKYGSAVDFRVIKNLCRSFGFGHWVGAVSSLAVYEFMPFLVNYFSSTHQAGIFFKSFTVSTFPVMLSVVCVRLVSPLYAHHQFDLPQLRSIFIKVQAFKFLLLVPGQLFLSVMSPYWIPALFGPAWVEMIPIYKILTIYGIMRAFFDDVPTVLSLGFKRPWENARNLTAQALFILIFAPWLVYHWAAFGAAIAITSAMFCATISMWIIVLRQLECSPQAVGHEVSDLYIQGKVLIKKTFTQRI